MEMVEHWGMSAVAVAGGDEAAGAIESESESAGDDDGVALALIDVMMPGMSGIETARRVRERFGEKAPRIIFLAPVE